MQALPDASHRLGLKQSLHLDLEPVQSPIGNLQVGLGIALLLERQKQELGHSIRREFDVQSPLLGGNVVDILPDPMIGKGCHGLIKMASLDRLDGCDDLASAKPRRSCSSQSGTCDIELLDLEKTALTGSMS